MYSPFSTLIDSISRRALDTAICKPTLGLRYVDNIFAIWPQSHVEEALEEFHTHLIN